MTEVNGSSRSLEGGSIMRDKHGDTKGMCLRPIQLVAKFWIRSEVALEDRGSIYGLV